MAGGNGKAVIDSQCLVVCHDDSGFVRIAEGADGLVVHITPQVIQVTLYRHLSFFQA